MPGLVEYSTCSALRLGLPALSQGGARGSDDSARDELENKTS